MLIVYGSLTSPINLYTNVYHNKLSHKQPVGK